jgi:hypothetical protein
MLQWLRLRRRVQRIRRIAGRPLQILDSRQPSLMGPMWQSPLLLHPAVLLDRCGH